MSISPLMALLPRRPHFFCRYSTTSDNAFAFYKKAPENWQVYHHGYRSQVKSWPTNPLHVVADVLQKHPGWVVGDFGCGDAELARMLPKNTVHSFDLVAANDTVVACDMKRVPLKAGTLDAAVYCLSLMGTNVKVRCAAFALCCFAVRKRVEPERRASSVDFLNMPWPSGRTCTCVGIGATDF